MDVRTKKINGENIVIPAPADIFDMIFIKQKALADNYLEIEGMPPAKWDLHNADHQSWIKDFFWRTTEELMEASELYPSRDNANVAPLFFEEMSDALHFLIEPLVMIGYDHTFVTGAFPMNAENKRFNLSAVMEAYSRQPGKDSFPAMVFQVIYHLGMAANCLKNKKWKQTQMITDIGKFQNHYKEAMMSFLYLCAKCGMDHEDLYTIYMKKAMINKFRQETKY